MVSSVVVLAMVGAQMCVKCATKPLAWVPPLSVPLMSLRTWSMADLLKGPAACMCSMFATPT